MIYYLLIGGLALAFLAMLVFGSHTTRQLYRVLRIVGWLPAAHLFWFMIAFVATGGDPLPGHDGNRWVSLVVLAICGLCLSAWAHDRLQTELKKGFRA